MIAVYIRVSHIDQNLEGQRAEIQRWLDANHFASDQVRWFEDKFTGKSIARPDFQKLQRSLGRGVFDTVVCWKLDRLSRSFRDGVRLIGDWTQRGIRIVSVTQNIDMSGLTGQLIASVLFAVAEMELAHMKERQKAGIAVARAEGKYKGRKKGATKGKPERAKALRGKGYQIKEIATALNVTERTVQNYLSRA